MSATLLLGLALAGDRDAFSRWLDRTPVPDHPEVATGYRFSAEAFRDISASIERYPHRVEVERIGRTLRGEPIWAFHVTDPTAPVDRDVLVFAGIHALEWISTEVATTFLVDLVDQPIRGTRVTVIPLLNPDGRDKVEADLLAGREVYRRGNGAGVDLNRDFAVNREPVAAWRHLIPGWYATSDGPLSQPETRALDALAARGCYARAASLHAFGGFFYYPWAGRFERPEDRDTFETLGHAMEVAQGRRAYTTKQLSHWGFFFRAQGAELDHLYGKYGTTAFLIELTRSGLDPARPKTFKTKFRWYNPRRPEKHVRMGVAAVAELARHPALPGENARGVCDPPRPPRR